MIWLTGMALYLCIGAALGTVIDSDQMKKPVPYGNAPSIFSLRRLRVACYVVYSLFWLPLVLDMAFDRMRLRWRLWRHPVPPPRIYAAGAVMQQMEEEIKRADAVSFDTQKEFGGDKSKEGETHGS